MSRRRMEGWDWVGLCLILSGLLALGTFAVEQTVFRYRNETLTETQLTLRALREGGMPTLVCLVVLGFGGYLVFWRDR